MYTDTITIFNLYPSKLGNIWYPHVLRNVNLIEDRASVLKTYGADSTDNASLHVKYKTDENGVILIGGLPYLPPKVWQSQVNDELRNSITFNADANNRDFFIRGAYDETPIEEDPAGQSLYERMEKEFDSCYAITSVSSPYKVIPHFEIMAR